MEENSISDYISSLSDIIPALQLGLFPDGSVGQVYHIMGSSEDISTTTSIVSSNTNQDPFNTSGKVLYISSNNTTDTQTIYIEGVDYITAEIVSQLVTLQGATPILLDYKFRTINRAYNNSDTLFVGVVTIIDDDNVVYAHLPPTYNGRNAQKTLSTVFTVPKDYTAFITNWYGTVGKGKDIELNACSRKPGKVFMHQDQLFAFESTVKKELPWLKFTEGTDLKVCGITSVNTINTVCTYDIILLKNDFIKELKPLKWQ